MHHTNITNKGNAMDTTQCNATADLSKAELQQKLKTIKRISADQVDLSRVTWCNIVDLLTQIAIRSTDGCYCYRDTLANAMRGGQGVSVSTLKRVTSVAIELGVLAVRGRVDRRGTRSNEWVVNWRKLGRLAGSFFAPQKNPTPAKNEPPYNRNNLNCNTPTGCVEGETTSYTASRKANPATAEGLAWRIHAKLGKMAGLRDWQLLAKSALLAATVYSEQWLAEAVGLATGKRRPYAYLQAVLKDHSSRYGRSFYRDLATMQLPPGLAEPDWSQRLDNRARQSADPLL